MPDTLIIAGQTFQNVAGFKAVDSNDSTQIYIKPSGTAQITVSSIGTTTEDISIYASAQIEIAIPSWQGGSY